MTTCVIMEFGPINPADSSCASLWGLRIGLGVVPSADVRDLLVPTLRGAFHRTARGETIRLDRRCRDRGASSVSRPTDRRRTRARQSSPFRLFTSPSR
jgi:hypothetical protein